MKEWIFPAKLQRSDSIHYDQTCGSFAEGSISSQLSPLCSIHATFFSSLSLSLLHSVYLYFYVQGDAAGAKGIQFWRSFNSDSGGRIAQRRNITLLPWLLCTFTSCLEHPASRFFPVESALRFQSPYGTHHGS